MSRFFVPAQSLGYFVDPTGACRGRYVLFVPASKVPEGFPLGPNPRPQNTDRQVYKQVEASLLSGDGLFHLKHKGITIIAEDVVDLAGIGAEIVFDADDHQQGIVDGGHSYKLLNVNRHSIEACQFVKLEVIVGLAPEIAPEIAGGLNTSVQVQEMTLANLRNEFDWLKNLLADAPYFGDIAWRENEPAALTVRDVLSMLHCFDIFEFPNEVSSPRFPIKAYSGKAAVLKDYRKRIDEYKRLEPIVRDVLMLHDIIAKEGVERYLAAGGGLEESSAFERAERRPHHFTFTDLDGEYQLTSGATYPLLGAFRWCAAIDGANGQIRWKRDFDSVLRIWEELAPALVSSTFDTCSELGDNVNALGKSQSHWSNMYRTVALGSIGCK